MKRIPSLPSPALIVAVTALVLAMSGAALGLQGRNSVDDNDISKNAVNSGDIKNANVKSADIAADAVDGTKVADETLSDADIADYQNFGDSFVKVDATLGSPLASAQAAAPQTTLLTRGPVTLYAKCFRDPATNVIEGNIYVRTTTNGVIVQGTDQHPIGNAVLLDTTTTEDDSEFQTLSENTANAGNVAEAENAILAPDGTAMYILTYIAVKQGSLPGGNGAFGDGDVCLFGGPAFG